MPDKFYLILLLMCLLLQVNDAEAQRVDFESFPQLDANYLHLELELEVTSGPEVRADAVYQLQLSRDDIDSLKLDAVRMNIELVEWNGETVEYRMEDNQLVVMLPEAAGTNIDHSLRIRYRANPSFGLFEDEKGNIWSSGLPGSVRHWLPSMDHPRNSLTTDISLIFPAGKSAALSGVPGETSIESVDLQRVRFHSESEIPVSMLRFAIGDFDRNQTSVGRHQIYLYTARGLLSDEKRAGLLDDAYIAFRHAERTLNTNYPSRVLHVVILEDHKWETKNYGSGIVFGFSDLNNISGQVTFGVTGQWLGVQLREEQWEDANAVLLFQSWLHSRSDELLAMKDGRPGNSEYQYEGIYNTFSSESRASWTSFFQSQESDEFSIVLASTAPTLINDLPSVINWYDFASNLYHKTGRNLMQTPVPSLPEIESGEQVPVYRVVFEHDESDNRIRLRFVAEGRAVDELISVNAEEYTFDDKRSREITFTGESDEVVLNVSRSIENMKLSVNENQKNIELRQEKPFMFWLYQLQHDDDPESRADAAIELHEYADNPDLQLALLDIIDAEENPMVYAEAIRTLAAVTGGASGTDQIFRQRFSTGGDSQIQKAIVEAFANYQNNDAVISQLRNAIFNHDSRDVKEQAIRSLAAVADADRFRSLSESFLSDDRVADLAPLILRELARADETTAVVSMASAFIDGRYPYQNRVQVLDLLLDYDRSAERWERRINRLSSDNDPRIRLRILDGLQFLTSGVRNDIIEERLYEEYDDRVLRRLNQLRDT